MRTNGRREGRNWFHLCRHRNRPADLEPRLLEETPVVCLEPSCLSVFRDEAVDILPDGAGIRRLKTNSFLLSELLEKTPGYKPPKIQAGAVVHVHCHHKALMKMNSEESVLSKMGINYKVLDSGCCGMAGAFGFEKKHFDISIQAGERVLLPSVRKTDKDVLIIANGFSCREQIAQTTDRRALHLSQVIRMAMKEGPGGVGGAYPEKYYQSEKAELSAREAAIMIGAGIAIIGAWIMAGRRKKRWL
jgi:Fe-S oxidoreductase